MFEWWKDLIRPIRVVDRRFGVLRFLRDAGFWEGHTRFAPTARDVEVLITADAAGPTQRQHRFFADLEARYGALIVEITQALNREAERVGVRGSDYVLVAVDVPLDGDENAAAGWALSYEAKPPSWHFTVQMQGWSPVNVIAER